MRKNSSQPLMTFWVKTLSYWSHHWIVISKRTVRFFFLCAVPFRLIKRRKSVRYESTGNHLYIVYNPSLGSLLEQTNTFSSLETTFVSDALIKSLCHHKLQQSTNQQSQEQREITQAGEICVQKPWTYEYRNPED